MEENSVVVLFYSKYSKKCTDLLTKIQDKMDFRKICIDNKNIRDALLSESERFKLNEVPCFFVFLASGIMKQYEGQLAFEWASGVLSIMKNGSSVDPLAPAISPSERRTTLFASPDAPIEVQPVGNKLRGYLDLDSMQQPVEKEPEFLGMKRRIETAPLIQPQEKNKELESSMDGNRHDGNGNEKKVLDKKHDNIKNLAQILQAEREKTDELLNPNPVSKINT